MSADLWVCAALVVLVILIYAPVRHFEFVDWDDYNYILDNSNVLAGLTWRGVVWAFTTNHAPYWHPLTWISHLIDVQLFGIDPGRHHLGNVLLHAANSVLVFDLLRRLTGARWSSAAVAAIFAVHPVHVESVAWVSERKDVLSTYFALLAFESYVRFARSQRFRIGAYLLALTCFAAALMSKPMVVTVPVLLLLVDWWPLRRFQSVSPRRLLAEKLPFALLAGAVALGTIGTQIEVGAVSTNGPMTLGLRAANAVISYASYLGSIVWPAGLAAFYPYRWHPSAVAVFASAAFLSMVTVLAIQYRHRWPFLLFGWTWYVISVAPVSGLIQAGDQAMADRFVYFPMIGLLIAAVWAAQGLAERPGFRPAAGLALSVTIVALAIAARYQVGFWSDSVQLWRRTVAVTSDNARGYENLGTALRQRGQLDAALSAYESAARITPDSPVLQNSIGLVLIAQGKVPDAANRFSEAVRLNPQFSEARTNFGNALAALGRLPEAIDQFSEAIRLTPDDADAHFGLGGGLLRTGRLHEAETEYAKVVVIDPKSAPGFNALGVVQMDQGKPDAARQSFEDAIKLRPTMASAHENLGVSLSKSGDTDAALKELATALSIEPTHPDWHYNLAVLLIKTLQLDSARSHLHAALDLDPGFEPASRLLKEIGR